MIIEYYTKNNYGVPMEYIVDAKIRGSFMSLLKRSTINAQIRQDMKFLGVEFKEVIQPK